MDHPLIFLLIQSLPSTRRVIIIEATASPDAFKQVAIGSTKKPMVAISGNASPGKPNIFNPAITAFATQSSCATIPVNQEACDKMGVPQDISNIVLPMGATMHMDGSVLSAITKIAFLYGVFNMQFTGVGNRTS